MQTLLRVSDADARGLALLLAFPGHACRKDGLIWDADILHSPPVVLDQSMGALAWHQETSLLERPARTGPTRRHRGRRGRESRLWSPAHTRWHSDKSGKGREMNLAVRLFFVYCHHVDSGLSATVVLRETRPLTTPIHLPLPTPSSHCQGILRPSLCCLFPPPTPH